jgi:hypothetical protein
MKESVAGSVPAGAAAAESRPNVSFLAWSSVVGRSRDVAAALGGEARCFYSLRIVRAPLVPLRYGVDAVRTATYLITRRPRSLIVSNPPIFPVLLAMAYGRLTGSPVVLDSHPAAFGENGSRAGRLFKPFQARLARGATTTLVANDDLRIEVESWGARADVFHEAPPTWEVAAPRPLAARPQIMLVGILAPDEPLAAAVEAAGHVPEIDLLVAGDERKVPSAIREAASENVSFIGFLHGEDYRRALEGADVIVVLTTNPTAAMRAAHEAVYACRPLVTSDSTFRRTLFPFAVHVENTATGIAAGVRRALDHHAELVDAAPQARQAQEERWEGQVAALRDALGFAQ